MKLNNNVKTNNFNEIKQNDSFHKMISSWKNINFGTDSSRYMYSSKTAKSNDPQITSKLAQEKMTRTIKTLKSACTCMSLDRDIQNVSHGSCCTTFVPKYFLSAVVGQYVITWLQSTGCKLHTN